MIPWLAGDDPFPPVSHALAEPNGLLAAGGDLSRERLIAAYTQGIFPWYQQGEPILWWSPDPRMVLFPGEVRVSRSLAKTLRKRMFEVRMDTAFERVIASCAKRNGGGTWITPEMQRAYVNLHRAGLAHSVETYFGKRLAGGLYGVAIGRAFFGESMFYRVSNASKIALVYLMRQLERWDFGLMDCQTQTAHLASLGAREIPRRDFTRTLQELVNYPARAVPWSFDHDVFE